MIVPKVSSSEVTVLLLLVGVATTRTSIVVVVLPTLICGVISPVALLTLLLLWLSAIARHVSCLLTVITLSL